MPSNNGVEIDLDNYRNLFEHSQDGIYFSSVDGSILAVNQAFLEITGYSYEEVRSLNSLQLYANEKDRELFQEEILKKETVRDFQVSLVKKDNTQITCLLTSSVFRDENDAIVGFKGLVKDISQITAATSAFKTSEKRFRVLFHGSPDPILVEDLEGNILDANPAACDLLEVLYTELVGSSIFSHIHKEKRSNSIIEFGKVAQGKSKTYQTIVCTGQTNKNIPVEISGNRIKFIDQSAILFHIRDVSKRIEAEEELAEERRKRLYEITDVQEREKKRIARELHDGIGQMLFGTKIHLESLKRKVKGQDAISEMVGDIEMELSNIIEEVRSLSRRLRPSILDDFGLVPALEQLFTQFQKSTSVTINVKIAKKSDRLEGRYETAIYRIIQEAMNNAVRHGQAKQIWVNLEEKKSENVLIVRDDGDGFKMDEVEFGHGTTNMKERAETIGGIFEMSSVLNRGTVIKVIIPK